MANRRQRSQVDHQRLHIFVAQGSIFAVRHEREKRPPIVADAFAYGAGELIVGPAAGTGFRIGSQIGGDHSAWQAAERNNLPRPLGTGNDRIAMLGVVMLRVTNLTSAQGVKDVLATLDALWG